MGKKSPTRAELAQKRRGIVNALPFTCPTERGDQIVVYVQDRKLEKFERVARNLDLEIVGREDGESSQQGRRLRMTLETAS